LPHRKRLDDCHLVLRAFVLLAILFGCWRAHNVAARGHHDQLWACVAVLECILCFEATSRIAHLNPNAVAGWRASPFISWLLRDLSVSQSLSLFLCFTFFFLVFAFLAGNRIIVGKGH